MIAMGERHWSSLRVAFGSMIGGVRYSRDRGSSAGIVTIANMSAGPGYALARIPG
jgi:hypothetical protein